MDICPCLGKNVPAFGKLNNPRLLLICTVGFLFQGIEGFLRQFSMLVLYAFLLWLNAAIVRLGCGHNLYSVSGKVISLLMFQCYSISAFLEVYSPCFRWMITDVVGSENLLPTTGHFWKHGTTQFLVWTYLNCVFNICHCIMVNRDWLVSFGYQIFSSSFDKYLFSCAVMLPVPVRCYDAPLCHLLQCFWGFDAFLISVVPLLIILCTLISYGVVSFMLIRKLLIFCKWKWFFFHRVLDFNQIEIMFKMTVMSIQLWMFSEISIMLSFSSLNRTYYNACFYILYGLKTIWFNRYQLHLLVT